LPEINGKQWTKDEVHAALKAGRVEEVWPGATFEDRGETGEIRFADGSTVSIRFSGQPATDEIPVRDAK
jgi:hypothetical protein